MAGLTRKQDDNSNTNNNNKKCNLNFSYITALARDVNLFRLLCRITGISSRHPYNFYFLCVLDTFMCLFFIYWQFTLGLTDLAWSELPATLYGLVEVSSQTFLSFWARRRWHWIEGLPIWSWPKMDNLLALLTLMQWAIHVPGIRPSENLFPGWMNQAVFCFVLYSKLVVTTKHTICFFLLDKILIASALKISALRRAGSMQSSNRTQQAFPSKETILAICAGLDTLQRQLKSAVEAVHVLYFFSTVTALGSKLPMMLACYRAPMMWLMVFTVSLRIAHFFGLYFSGERVFIELGALRRDVHKGQTVRDPATEKYTIEGLFLRTASTPPMVFGLPLRWTTMLWYIGLLLTFGIIVLQFALTPFVANTEEERNAACNKYM